MNLKDYLSKYGSQAELARQIGAQPQLVWQWSAGVRPVPLERCVPIERATNGAVTRKDLRPDDWAAIWPELAISAPIYPVPSVERSFSATDAVAQPQQGAAHA